MNKDGMMIKDEMRFQADKGWKDGLIMSGKMEAVLYGPDGTMKARREVHNTVTTLCHKMAADQLLAAPAVVTPGWMELGTGSGQTAASSILAAYIAGSRTALDSKTRGANAIVTMVCTFPAGTGTGAVTEAGVFNVVTQNTTDLLLYSSFAVVNKGAADAMLVTWTLTFA
ncbi:MAG TPA: hypothetical protein VLH56_02405 [Dissulfurispiraceae bacterium]|nr:hypothetical protein [Dissulfurispiraceae bacterium]